ncbi:MAG TPA: hypothetical protein VGI85_06230 [Chthoniobacterales bacterium]|jgi:hypothetical protein
MQPLTPEKLLAVWEAGQPQHPLDRALTLLIAATPGASRDALADLSIGERDARLLQLRTLVLGSRAEGFAECPQCTERIEFPFDTGAFTPHPEGRSPAFAVNGLRSGEPPRPANGSSGLRPPTSRDLALVVAAEDEEQALRILLKRCGARSDLPNDAIEAASCALLEANPQAEITLDLECPGCAHRWELLFDIAEFFWTEISAQAQRLLREIDTLARAYGWTEREILGLSAQRRQTYLEFLAA